MKLEFDPAANAAYFEIFDAEIESTREIEPGIIADLDADGRIVGIEVLCKPATTPTKTSEVRVLSRAGVLSNDFPDDIDDSDWGVNAPRDSLE